MLVQLLAAAAMADAAPSEIVIAASRAPQESEATAASVSILDETEIQRLGEPLASSMIRLTPSAAVETGGPAGALSQVRIRGAEANHTLLFIDGIRANDPAAGDIPRFELLNADIVSRIEVVRGPQSALWGSDAIGGVVAINGVPAAASSHRAMLEAGSFGFGRGGVSAALSRDKANVAAALGWQSASGIDGLDGRGDRDCYRNPSARLRGSWAIAPAFEIGASAFSLNGRSEYDGVDLMTFRRADTLDSTSNRLSAGRLWISGGEQDAGPSGTFGASLVDSSNRNFLDGDELNRTGGSRWTANGQLQYRFATGEVRHTAIVALEHNRERFEARDVLFGGATNQRQSRSHHAVTAEWRAEFEPIVADIALRHDSFSSFKDATTLRASALVNLAGGFSIAGSYSEGIAQPSFFDLYGFFPGNFVGNPALEPESSRGFEASIRYRRGAFDVALTGYRQRLSDEIVDTFDPVTFVSSTINRDTLSRRSGAEVEVAWKPGEALRLSANYSLLRATEPGGALAGQLRELRRPRHSGSIRVDGIRRRLTYGASLAYVGRRFDTDFDMFPSERVALRPYWLAGARLGYSLRPGLEIFARGANLFDERYQDVLGYRTEGRAVYAGIRIGGK
ncbi:TonB-dependent receptor [soil metagenome]